MPGRFAILAWLFVVKISMYQTSSQLILQKENGLVFVSLALCQATSQIRKGKLIQDSL